MAPVLQLPWGEVAVLVGVVLRLGLIATTLDRQSGSYDINRYFNIARDGIPYRDQEVEYPPLTVGVLEFLHLFARDRASFGVAIIVCMVVVEALVCVLMWRAFGNKVGIAFLILDTPLYYLLLTRVDIISVALAAAFIALALRGKQFSSGLAWIGAVAAKIWPFPLGFFLLTKFRPWKELRRALLGAAVGAVIVGAAWLAIDGLDGVRQVITFRGSQGWQIESYGGTLVHLFGTGSVYFEQGSNRIGQVPPGVGLLMQVVGTGAAIAVCIWAGRQNRYGVGWVTAVMCLLVGATLLSPQFLIWAVPGTALAVRESRPWPVVAGFTVTLVLTLGESRIYGQVIDGSALGYTLLIARNLALLATLGLGIWTLRRPSSVPSNRGWSASPVQEKKRDA
jgi:hypothetical protein